MIRLSQISPLFFLLGSIVGHLFLWLNFASSSSSDSPVLPKEFKLEARIFLSSPPEEPEKIVEKIEISSKPEVNEVLSETEIKKPVLEPEKELLPPETPTCKSEEVLPKKIETPPLAKSEPKVMEKPRIESEKTKPVQPIAKKETSPVLKKPTPSEPQKIPAQPVVIPSTPTQSENASTKDNFSEKIWLMSIRKEIAKSLIYPKKSRILGHTGTCMVEMDIFEESLKLLVKTSSGYKLLDEEALRATRSALQKFPAKTTKLQAILPVTFRLR